MEVNNVRRREPDFVLTLWLISQVKLGILGILSPWQLLQPRLTSTIVGLVQSKWLFGLLGPVIAHIVCMNCICSSGSCLPAASHQPTCRLPNGVVFKASYQELSSLSFRFLSAGGRIQFQNLNINTLPLTITINVCQLFVKNQLERDHSMLHFVFEMTPAFCSASISYSRKTYSSSKSSLFGGRRARNSV